MLALTLSFLCGCRDARSSGPVRQPSAEREYREIEALEWRSAEGRELAPHLNAPWPKVRRRAVVAYARSDRGRSPRPLLERWRVEEDPGARAELVFALRAFDRSSVIDVLEAASGDEDAAIREAVAAALRAVPDSRELAERLAQDDEPAVRQRAALSLALSRQSSASFWADRLTKESDQEVRWVLFAGAAHDPRLARELEPALVPAIADRNFLVGVFALDALGRLEPAVDSRESAPDESSRGLDATLEVAGNTDAFWLQREAAARSLARRLLHDERLTEEERRQVGSRLIELVESEAFAGAPPVLRYRLARSLCAARGPGVVARLRELTASSDEALRAAVAQGLADVLATRPDSELAVFLSELRTNGPAGARAAAARIPGVDGRAPAWALADPSPDVRAAALEAAAPAPAVLEAALRDPSPRVRRVALERVAAEELPLNPELLHAVAVDPHPSRWSSRMVAMDLLCERRPGERGGFLAAALADSSPVITRHALAVLRRLGMQSPTVPDDVVARAGMVPGFPLIERDPIEWLRRPRVIVGVDGKEPFVLELFVDEAPLHASSFLSLAMGGYYTGRAVAAIDVAGGVRFQDDAGRHPLIGQPLPPEDSVLPFARGSLVSVPVYGRDAERWDAVGEWQITLLPRPELTGRGTCWGRVYIGMHVVDRLAPGDRIVSIEIVD